MDLKNEFHYKLQQSIELLQHVFLNYEEDEIFLSFNGGKDCTVLLDVVKRLLPSHLNYELSLRCIYVQPVDPFEEIEEFVDHCKNHYNINIETMRGGIKSVLERICQENPRMKSCLMGSRRSDPYCELLKPIQETDPDWPLIMRINPLLDWSCAEVWDYIRENNVPYCCLYDRGYTSIGDKSNTIPNPHLKRIGECGEYTYLPAYQLQEADKYERAGRM
ncbi:FAD synthase-like [Malaya genurostris]|uniref:FAD synthase-like n=1 Tax=Malaya genurostris TaxID=325434 RepID=UPI0026F3A347|nr:FAD synthase-like [Malaya genurostris]